MIILDEGERRTKTDTYSGLTLRHPQAAYVRSHSPLPDYDTSEAEHCKVVSPLSTRRINPRIWKGILIALGVYLVLTLAIGVPLAVLKLRENNAPASWNIGSTNALWAVEDVTPLPPLQIAIAGAIHTQDDMTCNDWHTRSATSATAHFQLPPTGLINIRSNLTYIPDSANHASGNLSVDMNENPKASMIDITVDMHSSSKRLQRQTSICFNEVGPSRGLSLYIPADLGDADVLWFSIHVALPQVKSTVDSFVTYLPMFSQVYGDLGQQLSFGQFALEGALGSITCKFLQAHQISVKNIAAPIFGAFNVSDALTVDCIRGSITGNITLSPLPLQIRPTLLSLDTGDSAIKANITLNAPPISPPTPNSPTFAAQVNNFNGPLRLDIAYTKASSISPFRLQVQNNLAQSMINFDANFYGTFSAQTKMSLLSVTDRARSVQDDPTGANRNRTISFDLRTPSRATGWVGWGRRPMVNQRSSQSAVEIVSALSAVNLTFGS
ncbi:hypothetical protein B0H34DRAFT_698295 [Crassisporium funariophilum]|nr:hypothetical protein B0H34DRAFT_698295 [Crassisporium funariophilum]